MPSNTCLCVFSHRWPMALADAMLYAFVEDWLPLFILIPAESFRLKALERLLAVAISICSDFFLLAPFYMPPDRPLWSVKLLLWNGSTCDVFGQSRLSIIWVKSSAWKRDGTFFVYPLHVSDFRISLFIIISRILSLCSCLSCLSAYRAHLHILLPILLPILHVCLICRVVCYFRKR